VEEMCTGLAIALIAMISGCKLEIGESRHLGRREMSSSVADERRGDRLDWEELFEDDDATQAEELVPVGEGSGDWNYAGADAGAEEGTHHPRGGPRLLG
jgi:hypothetical protein